MTKLRFIDLFCGIGGFRQALAPRGHQCVMSSDWDPHAQSVYLMNYGESPLGDLTRLSVEEVPPHDLLCGGFPCQPFSISGNRLGFEDARGTLLQEILRIAKARKPAALLLENVRNYLTHDGGRTLAATNDLLRLCGYEVFHQTLNASHFGVPQRRERLFFVCFRKDLGVVDFRFPDPPNPPVSLEERLLPADDPRLQQLVVRRSDLRMKDTLPSKRENRPLRIGTVGKGGQGERVYSSMGHAVTLSAFGGGVGAKTGMYRIGSVIRRLHPEECRRIMGFAEGFLLHPKLNVCYKQFGNSVVVPVVAAIALKIEEALEQAGFGSFARR